MSWLVSWRAVQGFGAGGLAVTATALIADVIPLRERGKYQGALGAVFGVTTVLGPLVGGLFTDHLSWRWAFYVDLPIGIGVIALAAVTMPAVKAVARPVLDYLGIAFISLGAAGLTLGLSWAGTQYDWTSPVIIGLFVGSLVSLALFVVFERRAVDPVLPLRLFHSSVFSVSVVLAFIVGFALLGAMTFLPTYLQYVQGTSATSSRLQTLPMMLGLLVTSIAAGTIVGRTGRYKIFPVAGTLIMALGLFLLSLMDAATAYWFQASSMTVLGVGIGLSMQVLTIIVQNTVSYSDLGVATSGVTFFRTLGSSFGAAVFGTVYANVLRTTLPDAVRATGVNPATIGTPADLHAHPSAQIAPIVDAYGHAIHVVFLAAVPVAGLAFVLSLFLKEVPLRETSRAAAADVGEGFGMPEGADNQLRLQTAIARLMRTRGPEAAQAIRAASGTSLDVADGWCVGQVHIRERVGRETSLQAIGRRVRVPAQVLKPAFDTTRTDGYLAGDDDHLHVTDAGEHEIRKLVTATHDWLAAELADWGAQDDELLTRALDDMAKQVVDQDAELGAARPPTALPSAT